MSTLLNRRAFFGTVLAIAAPKPSLTAPVAPGQEITFTIYMGKDVIARSVAGSVARLLPGELRRLQVR